MFAADCVLITQDKKTFQGKEQVLRRLEKGALISWGRRG